METFYIVTLVLTALILFAAFSSILAFRFGAPLLLLFLLVGLIAGVDGLGIEFSNYEVAYTIGSIALAVILFDSGYGTTLHSFKIAAAPAIVISTLGVLLTASLFGAMACWILDFSLLEGLLLGSIVASTDAAAVFFLLRIGGINIRDRVRSTLEVESGTNDPMAIFLTIALVTLITEQNEADGSGLGASLRLAWMFVEQMGMGLLLGLIGGYVIVFLVRHMKIERGLLPIVVLSLSLIVFSYTGAVGGSGFLAVYVAGIFAGNKKIQSTSTVSRFLEGMTWLAQIIMFLVLGLLATPSDFINILMPASLLALFLVFIARPIAVWLSLLPFDFTQRETGFIAWVGLRGAVSILLSILPVLGGIENGVIYFNTTFIVVMLSLAMQGWTIKPMARALGLIIPPRLGAIEKFELDLPGTANHELVAYRVSAGSPILSGERIPRWALPSLVIRDGKSMRYQYAGRLRENDQVYLFIAPGYSSLLDRLFAEKANVDTDDTEFFGTFAISPSRSAEELDNAYGPDLIIEQDKTKTVAELIEARLGSRPEYGDRVRIGNVILIVRDTDENGRISSVGISMEAVTSATNLLIFLNMRELAHAIRDLLRQYRQRRDASQGGENAA